MTRKRNKRKIAFNLDDKDSCWEKSKEDLFYNLLKAKTPNQELYLQSLKNNKITIVVAPVGTGKTRLASIFGMIGLLKNEYKKLVLVRPAITAGESLGFLPGLLEDKMKMFLEPIYSELEYVVDRQTIDEYIKYGTLEILTVGHARGRNLINSFVIADEMHNATWEQTKLILTRIGRGTKLVLTCDFNQSDLPYEKRNKLPQYLDAFSKVEDIGVVYMNNTDIVREKVVKDLLEAIEKKDNEKSSNSPSTQR